MNLTPGTTVTLRVKTVPTTAKGRKTIERLMRLNPKVQRTLDKVAKVRGRTTPLNQRGGRMWASRMVATKCVNCEAGATFPLRITPQIMPDVASVGRYIEIA